MRLLTMSWVQDTTSVVELATAVIVFLTTGWAVVRGLHKRLRGDRPEDRTGTSNDSRR